MVAMATMVA